MMKPMSSIDFHGADGGEFLTGRFLVAMPGIGDPRFQHAVILVCMHTPDHAMGIRINVPYDGTTVAVLLERLNVPGVARRPNQLVLTGGPVERERGYVLHTDDFDVPGSTLRVCEGVSLSATRDVLETLTDRVAGPSRSVLALGYAGWGAGQLENELRDNVWLTCPADADLIFDDDLDAKWSRALGKLGVTPAALSWQVGRA
jgi:putative transcriptional regulator